MKNRVYTALGFKDDSLFEDMLARDEAMAQELLVSLDKPSNLYSPSLIFYPMHHDVEEMVEVVEGKCRRCVYYTGGKKCTGMSNFWLPQCEL